MNNDNETLLDRFFDRSIGRDEKSMLDNRISTDAELSGDLIFRKKIGEAFASAEHQNMKNILKEEEARLQKTTLKTSWLNPKNLMAMAAILVGVAAAVWFFQTPPPDGAAIFAQNFGVEKLGNDLFLKNAGFRSAGKQVENAKTTPADSVFVEMMRPALEKYEAENYPEAIAAFEKIQATEPKHLSAVQFYLGVCFNAQKGYGKAVENLTKVAARKDKYLSPALWQLAMAQFGSGNISAGKTALQDYIASPDGIPKRSEAASILKKLK